MTPITIGYIILAALALGVLVFIHELGHLIAARLLGMDVEIFSIGFGKPLFSWKWKKVKWQLSWLPFGGYVKIAGMELGKKEKNAPDPYTTKNGFFGRPPWQRMIVVLAGPAANIILALIFFGMVWGMGGRQKPFSEFTQIIGWIEPQSELYRAGLRPGDRLTQVDGKRYDGSKDLIFLAFSGKKETKIEGYRIDWDTGNKTPFTYTIEPYKKEGSAQEYLSSGITGGASFLIYDRLSSGDENPLPQGSPMQDSGIQYGDRIVWADGQLIFSMEQMSHLLNDGQALLRVKRGGRYFYSRQPRVSASNFKLPVHIRNELIDAAYESGVKGKWQNFYILPYTLSEDNQVTGELEGIDDEVNQNTTVDQSRLQLGDQIVAVDGFKIKNNAELLSQLQEKHFLLIVDHKTSQNPEISWKNEDDYFATAWNVNEIEKVATLEKTDRYEMLKPIQPKRLEEFSLSEETQSKLRKNYAEQKERIKDIKNEKSRRRAERELEESYHRYLLGIQLQDLSVRYNPTPVELFKSVVYEIGQTLHSLIFGSLSPKNLSGPVGIVQIIHQGWTLGIGEALFWIGAISLNLGILNLLPIPILDGGYVCLSLYEMITKRKLKPKTMERLIIPFVVLIVGLILFLTFQDITRLFR